jgi:hypothetical protein
LAQQDSVFSDRPKTKNTGRYFSTSPTRLGIFGLAWFRKHRQLFFGWPNKTRCFRTGLVSKTPATIFGLAQQDSVFSDWPETKNTGRYFSTGPTRLGVFGQVHFRKQCPVFSGREHVQWLNVLTPAVKAVPVLAGCARNV